MTPPTFSAFRPLIQPVISAFSRGLVSSGRRPRGTTSSSRCTTGAPRRALAARIKERADQEEDDDRQDQEAGEGHGFRDLLPDEEIEHGGQGERQEQGQAEGHEDRLGQLEEDPGEKDDDDRDSDLEEPVVVHARPPVAHHN